jgi:exosortase/archaeosortase family protein
MGKLKSLLADKGVLFSLKILFVYLCWKAFAHFTHDTAWWHSITYRTGSLYASAAAGILSAFGEKATPVGPDIYMAIGYMNVADHCLAFPAMVIYAGSILLFPGKWINKLWYIPMGWLIMICINLIRICLTSYAWEHFNPFYFKLNHSVIFVIVFYSTVFALIALWMKKYSQPISPLSNQ